MLGRVRAEHSHGTPSENCGEASMRDGGVSATLNGAAMPPFLQVA